MRQVHSPMSRLATTQATMVAARPWSWSTGIPKTVKIAPQNS